MATMWETALDLEFPPAIEWEWEKLARREQLPPPGDWFVWMIMAGRANGKTRTGSEWLARQAQIAKPTADIPEPQFAVVARTTQDCREVCVEGPSGLLRALNMTIDDRRYNRTTGEVRLASGAVIHSYSAEKPGRLRGPNLSGAWCDEIGQWTYEATWYEALMPALRIGDPRVVVTTTPKRTPLIKDLLTRDDGSVHITRGATFDNAANLSASALAELKRRYEGTRIGRQELYGEMLDDVEGALWTNDMFDDRVGWEVVPTHGRVRFGITPGDEQQAALLPTPSLS